MPIAAKAQISLRSDQIRSQNFELETYMATSLEGLKQEMLKFLGGFGITPTIQNPTIEEIASIFNRYFHEPVEIILP